MNEVAVAQIDELKQAEAELTKHTSEVLAQYEEPLTFSYPCTFAERRTEDAWADMDWADYQAKERRTKERRLTPSIQRMIGPERRFIMEKKAAQIETGILWIPPFAYDFWSWRRKKPKPNKCICTCCGHKHNLKGA